MNSFKHLKKIIFPLARPFQKYSVMTSPDVKRVMARVTRGKDIQIYRGGFSSQRTTIFAMRKYQNLPGCRTYSIRFIFIERRDLRL